MKKEQYNYIKLKDFFAFFLRKEASLSLLFYSHKTTDIHTQM